jgi:N-glycosylase/DNA lyase
MPQLITMRIAGRDEQLTLPDPDVPVMPGVCWGPYYATFTPAFWASQAWLDQADGYHSEFRLGDTLKEEIAACLLGGYGIPAEVGLAAFYRLRDSGLLQGKPPSKAILYKALASPLLINQRSVHYRFASQRSHYLSEALMTLEYQQAPVHDDLAFRKWLLGFKGIGPKTASWITRNWLSSDRVAIIDIHIYRAGLLVGLYNNRQSPAREYFEMEDQFLAFAHGIRVKASTLDALIWRRMKNAGDFVFTLIKRLPQ